MNYEFTDLNREPEVIEFEGGIAFLNPSNDTRTEGQGGRDHITFKALTVGGTVALGDTYDERRDSKYLPTSKTHHVIRPGEIIVFHTDDRYTTPSVAMAPAFPMVRNQIDLDKIDEYPELQNALRMFGDQVDFSDRRPPSIEDRFIGSRRDHNWFQRYHYAVSGERSKPRGGLNKSMIRAQEGHNNCEYDALYFMGVNAMRTKRPEDYAHFITSAVAVSSLGVFHSGPTKGMLRYPKSAGMNGDYYGASWAKQWWPGLFLAGLFSGHPIIKRATDAFLQRMTIDRDWDFKWGARIGARYMASLRLAWYATQDQRYLDLLFEECARIMASLKPGDRYFMNRGSQTAPESPWMILQLTDELHRAQELGAIIDLFRLKQVVDNTLEDALTRVNGIMALNYRIGTKPEGPQSLALLAFALPEMRRHSHPDLQESEDTVYKNIGSTFQSLARDGGPFPIEEVGLATGAEGLGGIKARTFVLRSLLK